jgi:hypothetical protein
MRKKSLVILSIFVVSICTASSVQFQEWVGKTARAIHKADLHLKPPQGLFCNSGDDIDTIQVDERVKITKYLKVSCGLILTFEFFEIQRDSPGIPPEKRIGYVRATDDEKPRFQLVPNQSPGG